MPRAYLVPALSITPANWVGSVWCGAVLTLAGCAGAPPAPPVPPPPAPAAATPPYVPGDFVAWDAKVSAAIACPLTKTQVEVPEAWRADVRRIDAGEVVWQTAGGRRSALLVRGADHRLTRRDGLDDMKRLLELIDVPLPGVLPGDEPDRAADPSDDEDLLPLLGFVDMNATPYELELEPPRNGTVVFGYRIVVRDDATCRLATAALKSDPTAEQLSDFLDAVDTPRPADPQTLSFIHTAPKIPPASCRAWPVWIFPSCGPAKPAPTSVKPPRKP
jgi:hypothetical protein